MIDRAHALPIAQQARLVGIARSSVYYQPQPVSEMELKLMHRIDELHLEFPFAGARMLARLLRREGIKVGRRHVGSLMMPMGINALYCKPNTSRRDKQGSRQGKHLCAAAHKCLPCSPPMFYQAQIAPTHSG